jgi:hypothetical protein
MKTSERNRSIWLMTALLFLGATLYALPGNDEDLTDTINYKSYYGRVVDASTKNALPFATIEALGSNTATVTNIDGDFIIKIERNAKVSQLKISYVGYTNKVLDLSNFNESRSFSVELDQNPIQLKQVTIRPTDAMELISDVLSNIKNNYSEAPMMMRGFYRETIQRGKNYVSISEAIIDVYKGGYNNEYQVDQVKLVKGRKSADVEKMDTVLFKVQGGPNTTILMDVVKNPYILLSDEYRNVYDFHLTDVITLDDKLHYVVSFNQKEFVVDPYYRGKLYIEMDRLAITEAEFELNVENQDEAARLFIQRKPMGMSIIPERAVYRAMYTIDENTWYFSYARAEVKFKVNWKKKLFNTTYSTMSELAMTDRTYEGIEKFAGKDRFRSNDILDEKVYIFFDQGFWEGYNVIEPDQSIESAIEKLNRKYLRRNG